MSGQHAFGGGWRTPPEPGDWHTTALMVLMLALLVIGFALIAAALNEWVYGDWRCAFAECRRIVTP